jgi:hypothetical protein
MGLVVWIAIHIKNIPDLLHYMDNAWSCDMDSALVFYPPYNEYYPMKQVRLLQLWDEISLPHEKSKQLFGKSLRIIGVMTRLFCHNSAPKHTAPNSKKPISHSPRRPFAEVPFAHSSLIFADTITPD